MGKTGKRCSHRSTNILRRDKLLLGMYFLKIGIFYNDGATPDGKRN